MDSTNGINTHLKFMHRNLYIIINWLFQVMVFATNNIRYQQVIFVFDPVKSIQLLNYIDHYVNQDIHSVDNDNYVIHIIYEYDFYNTLLLRYDFDHGNNSSIITYFMISSQMC